MGTQEIASVLKVCVKTIQRDLNQVLSKNGAIKIGKKWKMEELCDENQLIITALDTLANNLGKEFYAKAHGLLKGLSSSFNNSFYICENNEKLELTDLDNMLKIEQAITKHNLIEIKYNNKKYKIAPIKIAMFDGFWYVFAMDKKVFKKFHLKSIKELEILSEYSFIPSDIESKIKRAKSAWFNLADSFTVRLWVSSEIAKYFDRKPLNNNEMIYKNSDGSFEIEFMATHIMEVKPLIYRYLPHIRVLEPDFLADEIESDLNEYLKG
ncbi:MAG: WYL domain-containing protein [Campylobacter sp.]|uniref:helix-turn-helix transcriptional regulator n=1 Tax=Campylobacter sp. TaxID=205 RepID=UPI002AA782EB|nr:WYL domain-containing protein [Campylobacter sp.]MCI6579424.1 WYL domain-containing protein [Campylobacter sp.]MCI7014465.1 WYL domain-containing protein [Campylobacter sp.]